MSWPEKVWVYTDGASRGNPGPAAIGVVFYDEHQKEIHSFGEILGEKTNNVAEYQAVVSALRLARKMAVVHLVLRSDSQLLVRQIAGEYRVKAPALQPLFRDVIGLVQSFDHFECEHVRREENKRADQLANLALDTHPY